MSTTPTEFIPLFERTTRLVNEQAKGLTHKDSLIQPPFRGNCFNWVVGHLVQSRDEMLEALGEAQHFPEAEAAFYKRGSEAMKDRETAVPLPRLLQLFNDQSEHLVSHFKEIAAESLAVIIFPERNRTVGEWLAFLHWHETYHVGQLELLRQLSGVNDAVIR
jgi:uncharacterized damage-inducible protein DinB